MAFFERAIPEEGYCDTWCILGCLHLRRKRCSRRDRYRSRDDRHRAQNSNLCREQMHRPTSPAGTPARFAENFGEQGLDRATFGDVVAVRAMTAPDRVLAIERRAHAGRDRLLADVQMARTADLAAVDHIRDDLLRAADAPHRAPLIQAPGGWHCGQ